MRVLGLIPARGGSKSVPHKNIRVLHGKPLLQYTAEVALAAQGLSRVILSTDDEDVAKVGKQCGLDVPFMRPDELAQDDTPMLPVVQHAIYKLESMGAYYDAVCLLQPTTPLRTVDTIDGCIHLLEESSADAVATVLKVPVKYNPHWVYFENEKGLLHLSTGEQNPIARRQDLPDAFHREGSVYVARRRTIMEQQSLYGNHFVGYIINQEQHVNIDTLDDWERAERLLESTFS